MSGLAFLKLDISLIPIVISSHIECFLAGDILSKPSAENPERTDLDIHCLMGETERLTNHHQSLETVVCV